jgi:hypothetical protein
MLKYAVLNFMFLAIFWLGTIARLHLTYQGTCQAA